MHLLNYFSIPLRTVDPPTTSMPINSQRDDKQIAASPTKLHLSRFSSERAPQVYFRRLRLSRDPLRGLVIITRYGTKIYHTHGETTVDVIIICSPTSSYGLDLIISHFVIRHLEDPFLLLRSTVANKYTKVKWRSVIEHRAGQQTRWQLLWRGHYSYGRGGWCSRSSLCRRARNKVTHMFAPKLSTPGISFTIISVYRIPPVESC